MRATDTSPGRLANSQNGKYFVNVFVYMRACICTVLMDVSTPMRQSCLL